MRRINKKKRERAGLKVMGLVLTAARSCDIATQRFITELQASTLPHF